MSRCRRAVVYHRAFILFKMFSGAARCVVVVEIKTTGYKKNQINYNV